MKSTGVVRKFDGLGRVVLPIELRNMFDIQEKDAVEIFIDNDAIVLKKYVPGCIFCGNVENITMFENKKICKDCLKRIKTA